MKLDQGSDRVLEPIKSVSVSAWKLDDNAAIHDNEMRIRVKYLKMEDASFKQICTECDFNDDKIQGKIKDIVKKRGKLHNPATGSGGILCGAVDEIGCGYSGYKEKDLFKTKENIISLTSLTAIPLHLESINSIDYKYGIITVDGYAILSNLNPIIHQPSDLPLKYTLYAFEEAGSLRRAAEMAKNSGSNKLLILASDLLSLTLYAAALRKGVTDQDTKVVAVLDKSSVGEVPEERIHAVIDSIIDQVYMINMLTPQESCDKILGKEGSMFDYCVNCAALIGADALSVLLTKSKGTIVFTSFINNLNTALLFAESLGKEINAYATGVFTEGYERFTLELLQQSKSKLDIVDRIYSTYQFDYMIGLTESHRKSQALDVSRIGDVVFSSEKMKTVLDDALNVAGYDCNVVILGETGVGKEKILTLIHNNSDRKLNPCIRINCAAIPESLAESEFFGYEAGAFTGSAAKGKAGYFELAHNGILFLDEVGLLSAAIQVKLLRVLQENQYFRIGGMKQMDVNVRIICATNVCLKQLIEDGRFREDLYYRLNICEIKIPPLRERPEDIACLAEFFLEKYSEVYHIKKHFEPEALKVMIACEWPGNVRELENTVHRLIVSSHSDRIDESMVIRALDQNPHMGSISGDLPLVPDGGIGLDNIMMNYERKFIEDALKKWKNTRKAAAYLGISQSQLMRKKQKYNIE